MARASDSRPRRLSAEEARRLALLGQGLIGARPRTVVETVERLGRVQVDPTSIVERAERLTLWSRLGGYDRDELRAALEVEPRGLFEYVGFILPVADLALHRPAMRRYPRPEYTRGEYVAGWLRDNAAFREYVLDELRRRGPLRSRDLDDRAEVPWQTGGWNDGKNLGRMLEILWRAGEIAVTRREGTERVWDLVDRVLPVAGLEELPDEVVAIELMDRQLRTRALVRPGWGSALDYGLPAREVGEESLRSDGIAVAVTIDGLPGEWISHADLLAALDDLEALDEPGAPRTTLIGPFDPLIADREQAVAIFGFAYRFELYKPAARREFGPYALPILDGTRLVGRVDAAVDRRNRALRLNGIFAEPGAPADAGPRVAVAIGELADWLGAETIDPPDDLPPAWRSTDFARA